MEWKKAEILTTTMLYAYEYLCDDASEPLRNTNLNSDFVIVFYTKKSMNDGTYSSQEIK